MPPALELDLRAATAPARLLAKVQSLAADLAPPASAEAGEPVAAETKSLVVDGYTTVTARAPRSTRESLVILIDRLIDAGLPAVFVFVTDDAIALGQQIETAVSTMLREPYVLIDDVWAWRVERGSSGWAPHRGVTTRLDRARPELVNTWVALSAAPEDRSCMHFVPLGDDPLYPEELTRTDFQLSGVRAAPLEAGAALVWNANVLHWGGVCAPTAEGPRVSCSFSLVRADTSSAPACPVGKLDPLQRVDLVASQIATYGQAQPDVSPEILEWARATCGLRALTAASRKER